MKLHVLSDRLSLTHICGSLDKEAKGVYVGDLLSWVMSHAVEGDVWITIMSNVNVAAVASLTEAACVILAEGVEPDPETEGVEGLLMGPDENVEILYRKEPYLTAPVEAGECVGEISYLVDGRIWRRERLTAAKDVEAIDFVWCGRQILLRFLVRSL